MEPETIKLEREVTRLTGRSRFGGVTIAVQYHDEVPWPLEGTAPAQAPIYVGFDGEQGQPLDEVLSELYQYRRAFGKVDLLSRMEEFRKDLGSQFNMIQRANERITGLEKHPRGIIEWLGLRKRGGHDAK